DLRMVLFVLKAHRALDFGGGVDEDAQRVSGQRVIIAAGVDVLEPAGFVIASLGVGSLEEEAFDLVGRIGGIALLLMQAIGELLENAAHVGGVGFASLVDDVAKNQNFARTENIRRRPVEGAPIHTEA